MKSLYRKNELLFSFLCIVLYVLLFSAADMYSQQLGVVKCITAPFCLIVMAVLWLWIAKNGVADELGLCAFKGKASRFLYFVPLLVIGSVNLWGGVQMEYSALETVLYVLSMLCVGFIEEVIFRGLLFKALCRESVKRAVVIASLTFGIGHIVNLLNGAEVVSTLLQLCYACAVGFLFCVIVLRGGSLVPCILTHSVINATSAFGVSPSRTFEIVVSAILTVFSVAYALWILKANREVAVKAVE